MNTVPVKFAIHKIVTEQFAVIEENYHSTNPTQYSFSFEFNIEKSQPLISVFFKIHFLQNRQPFLMLLTACHFKIFAEQWESFYTANRSQIVVPKQFMAHLCMIATGTARGVLHSKVENTPFNRFSVPLINVVNAIKEDVIFGV